MSARTNCAPGVSIGAAHEPKESGVKKIAGYEIHPAADLFDMLAEDDLERLSRDIKANGLRVPIVLLAGKILDGRNRLLACERAGVEPRFERIGSDHNPWRAVWSLNRERRQIEDKVRLALIGRQMVEQSDAWLAAQEKAKEEANRARSEKVKGYRNAAKNSPASCEAKPKAPASRDYRREHPRKAAARLAEEIGGVSRATVERAIELERANPEAAEAVRRGEKEGQKALGEVKRKKRVDRIVEISKGNAPLATDRRFPVIYADPPWRYNNTAGASAAEDHYPTMSLKEICALEVPATPDAVLFLWATSPLLPEAFDVIRSWGFTYKGSMVWSKGTGTGNWVLNAHEILLIATRGDIPCPLPSNRPLSVITAPRTRHSAKPAEFAEAIERMFPDLPKLEMFCRSPRDGWVAWGNEAAA